MTSNLIPQNELLRQLTAAVEQKAFAVLFKRTQGSTITSTLCPACGSADRVHKQTPEGPKAAGWIRGTIAKDTCAVLCPSCGYIRVSKLRSSSKN